MFKTINEKKKKNQLSLIMRGILVQMTCGRTYVLAYPSIILYFAEASNFYLSNYFFYIKVSLFSYFIYFYFSKFISTTRKAKVYRPPKT